MNAKDSARAARLFNNDGANVDEALSFTLELHREVAELFRGNSKHFHIGGDQFAGAVRNNEGYVRYVNQVAAELLSQGLTPRMWNDGVMTTQLGKLNPQIEITYWDWDGNPDNPVERQQNLENRATVGELVKAGYRVLNYNQHYLYHFAGGNSEYDAGKNLQKQQTDQWNIGRWDENNRENAVEARQMLGAAVSIWHWHLGGIPAPLKKETLRTTIEPQLRWVAQKVKEAEAQANKKN